MNDKQPVTIEEKIQRLKNMHAGSHPDALAQIRNWESRFAQLKITKDWLKHPITIELREMVIEKIEQAVQVLANTEDLSEVERRAIFEQKKAHLVYLAILTADVDGEIKAIERLVETEVT